MKTYDEYMDNIRRKVKRTKQRRRILCSSVAACLVLALGLGLILPGVWADPSVGVGGTALANKYIDSPYYGLMCRLNTTLEQRKTDGELGGIGNVEGTVANEPVTGGAADDGSGQSYVEVTDNQVAGVIEGDLFKRSDRYLYYLSGNKLMVYSIEAEDSQLVNSYDLNLVHGNNSGSWSEMYLSQDCSDLTVICHGYDLSSRKYHIVVALLDVSDPTNITTKAVRFFNSAYSSSRMVGGDLLLVSRFSVSDDEVDYDDPTTFVPSYGGSGAMEALPIEDILWDEGCTSTTYTVLTKLSGETLEVEGSKAMLGYSSTVYVSKNAVYFTCTASRSVTEDSIRTTSTWTTVTGIGYTGQGLEVLGSVELEGTVNDQYSMDEYEGILRVAVTYTRNRYEETVEDDLTSVTSLGRERNCGLYCIDLESWEVAASAVGFAPDREDVKSARFDGDTAYICTSLQTSDPVFFFDLSDLSNITWKETEEIGGYSTSLINCGEYLVGVGYSENWEMKIEVYVETENAVEPIAAYIRDANFSTEYKSYFIDRETGLLGLPVCDWADGCIYYLLFCMEGQELRLVQQIDVETNFWMSYIRATQIDGYLYVLSAGGLQVVPLD